MADTYTKIADLIDPEVMGDMVSARIPKKLRVAPFAKVDDTLAGVPGDTITVPAYAYIGDADIVAEGEAVTIEKMTTSTRKATVKKAMKGIGLTDEAVLSGYGNPVGEANTQLAMAIAAKIDNDCMDVLQTATLTYDGSAGIISYAGVVDAVDALQEEQATEKVIFVHPKQVTQLRKDAEFTSTDKYPANVRMSGEIGSIAGCRVAPSKKVPLVLVMHGYTASMYAIAEESRWYDVAEQNGFIVVFAQGLVRPADLMGNIPTAMWLAGPFAALAGKDTDPSVDLEFINSLLDRMERDYSIDTTRVYATGHSNGSLMTWATACRYASRFAAIAPVGYMFAPLPELDPAVLLPTWAFLGEYDSAGVAELVEDNGTVKALQGWNAHNATNEAAVAESASYDGAFVTKSFMGGNAPLVQYTVVKDTPHVYLQEESVAIWNEFFSRYSRGADGTLYYQGNAVTAGKHQPSADWYAAK